MKKISMLAMDVDGTMTDGKIYMGQSGELCKAFSVKDGQGIKRLKDCGVLTAVITARASTIVENRAKELSIDFVFQSVDNKEEVLKALSAQCSLPQSAIAYIGDDLGDLEALAYAGYSFCPKDSAAEVRAACAYVLTRCGGEGAIREAAEIILKINEKDCEDQ